MSLVSVNNSFSKLPEDNFLSVCSFLTPSELALTEGVTSLWRKMICSEDLKAWKEQCFIQNSISNPTELISEYSSEIHKATKFYSSIISIITDYAQRDIYKTFARTIFGNLRLFASSAYIGQKKTFWSDDVFEPTVSIQARSDESITACRANHGSCDNYSWQGTWQDIHPRIQEFPSNFPLRFLINPDGSYKQAGDKITLRFNNKWIVLTCTCKREQFDSTYLTTFADALAYRVDVSIRNGFITQAGVDKAKAAAKSAGGVISD